MMLRFGLLALSLASVAAHGAGVWRDPNHALGDGSLAGLRFIAESPPHVLTRVENKADMAGQRGPSVTKYA